MGTLETWRIVVSIVAFCLVVFWAYWNRFRTEYRILLYCTVGMTVYAMIQDQVSVRLAPEYFTVAHPRIEGLTDPTLLGIAWGFLASWWGGMLMGISVGLTATLGSKDRLDFDEVFPGLVLVLLLTFLASILAGIGAYVNGELVKMSFGGNLGEAVPVELQTRFFAVACTHFATYSVAILGSIGLCIWISSRRKAKSKR